VKKRQPLPNASAGKWPVIPLVARSGDIGGGEPVPRATTRCCKFVTVTTIRNLRSTVAADMSNIIPCFATATAGRSRADGAGVAVISKNQKTQ
jgi:hypothetical protein